MNSISVHVYYADDDFTALVHSAGTYKKKARNITFRTGGWMSSDTHPTEDWSLYSVGTPGLSSSADGSAA